MKDVRELLARLNPTTIRMNSGTGGGVDALTNIDIAGALGMVPAGLGRDLLELLHGPDPSRADILRTYRGIVQLAMEERNLRMHRYINARTTYGIAKCLADFERDRSETTRRNQSVLKARAAVARDQLLPECLEGRMPEIAMVAIGYMKGERLSNRERASALGISESTYREGWAEIVDWLLNQLVDLENSASLALKEACSCSARQISQRRS